MFFFCVVCVCRVIMKITFIVIANMRIHKRTARTIHSVQYSISFVHDIN